VRRRSGREQIRYVHAGQRGVGAGSFATWWWLQRPDVVSIRRKYFRDYTTR